MGPAKLRLLSGLTRRILPTHVQEVARHAHKLSIGAFCAGNLNAAVGHGGVRFRSWFRPDLLQQQQAAEGVASITALDIEEDGLNAREEGIAAHIVDPASGPKEVKVTEPHIEEGANSTEKEGNLGRQGSNDVQKKEERNKGKEKPDTDTDTDADFSNARRTVDAIYRSDFDAEKERYRSHEERAGGYWVHADENALDMAGEELAAAAVHPGKDEVKPVNVEEKEELLEENKEKSLNEQLNILDKEGLEAKERAAVRKEREELGLVEEVVENIKGSVEFMVEGAKKVGEEVKEWDGVRKLKAKASEWIPSMPELPEKKTVEELQKGSTLWERNVEIDEGGAPNDDKMVRKRKVEEKAAKENEGRE